MSNQVNILIVDDVEELLEMYTDFLTLSFGNVEVHTALDGVEGYAKACLHKYDIIISDYKMPNLDGVKMARYIQSKEDSLNHKTPFVLISGFVPELKQNESYEFADLILDKPVDVQLLSKKIQYLIKTKLEEL